MSEKNYFVHESSYIDEPSTIGEGTKIWHFSHICAHAVLGPNCNLGQNVMVGPNVSVGDGCRIQNNVSVYEGVELEESVFCGPSMVFTNVFNPRSEVVRKDEYRKTLVKKGASIGANATVVCGSTIGEYAFVGAGSVVTKDVPAYALVMGNPARRTAWMCRCGEKLGRGQAGETLTCPACKARYDVTADRISPKV